MKDKNYDGRSNRLLRTGKVIPLAATLIMPILFSDPGFAEDVAVEGSVTPHKLVQNAQFESLAPDSQPLSLDVPAGSDSTMVVEQAEVNLPESTQLAMAIHSGGSLSDAKSGTEHSGIDGGSAEAVSGESPQKHYALMLALLALISLVPMSRGHR